MNSIAALSRRWERGGALCRGVLCLDTMARTRSAAKAEANSEANSQSKLQQSFLIYGSVLLVFFFTLYTLFVNRPQVKGASACESVELVTIDRSGFLPKPSIGASNIAILSCEM